MLVTNGTLPKTLENLDTLPTQLYVSWMLQTRKFLMRFVARNGMILLGKIEETIDLLPSLDTRIVCNTQ